MKKGISCPELLRNIPEEVLEKIGDEVGVDKQVKKLRGGLLFKLLLYSLLNSERISLRVMETFWDSETFKVFSGKGNQTIKHSGIAERIESIWVNGKFCGLGLVVFKKIMKHFPLSIISQSAMDIKPAF